MYCQSVLPHLAAKLWGLTLIWLISVLVADAINLCAWLFLSFRNGRKRHSTFCVWICVWNCNLTHNLLFFRFNIVCYCWPSNLCPGLHYKKSKFSDWASLECCAADVAMTSWLWKCLSSHLEISFFFSISITFLKQSNSTKIISVASLHSVAPWCVFLLSLHSFKVEMLPTHAARSILTGESPWEISTMSSH